MHTLDLPESDRLETYAVLDIETDGFDGAEDHLVAVGVGFVETDGTREVAVHTLSDTRGDEAALVEASVEWLHRREPAGIVTYNGAEFDLPFLEAKLASLDRKPHLDLAVRHVDLFTERRRLATLADEKWPRLEECLEAYELPVRETVWEGELLTNVRFGEELAPLYLAALEQLEFGRVRALDRVIREYASADIEATMALYEADLDPSATHTLGPDGGPLRG